MFTNTKGIATEILPVVVKNTTNPWDEIISEFNTMDEEDLKPIVLVNFNIVTKGKEIIPLIDEHPVLSLFKGKKKTNTDDIPEESKKDENMEYGSFDAKFVITNEDEVNDDDSTKRIDIIDVDLICKKDDNGKINHESLRVAAYGAINSIISQYNVTDVDDIVYTINSNDSLICNKKSVDEYTAIAYTIINVLQVIFQSSPSTVWILMREVSFESSDKSEEKKKRKKDKKNKKNGKKKKSKR